MSIGVASRDSCATNMQVKKKNAQFVGWDQNDDGHKHMGFTMCISQSGGLLTGVLTNTF